MKKLLVATKNEGKATEIKELIGAFFEEVLTLNDLDKSLNIIENGKTFEENAYQKAKSVHSLYSSYGFSTLADDSGLEVDALNGAPGVFSARYAGEAATDEDRINKLLDELKDVPLEKRSARFVCALVFIDENGRTYQTKGVCEGKIGFLPEGQNGFGYDPIFIPNGYNVSFAQIPSTVKNKISHRAKAFEKLRAILGEINEDTGDK